MEDTGLETEDTGHCCEVDIIRGIELPAKDLNGKSDPYVVIRRLARGCGFTGRRYAPEEEMFYVENVLHPERRNVTSIIRKTLNPEWNECFRLRFPFPIQPLDFLIIEIWDWDRIGKHDFMGCVVVPMCELPRADTKRMVLQVFEMQKQDGRYDVVYGDAKIELAVTAVNFSTGPVEEVDQNMYKIDRGSAINRSCYSSDNAYLLQQAANQGFDKWANNNYRKNKGWP